MHCLYCFVGPSGSGKDTIARSISAQIGTRIVDSYTDRPKRTPSESGHTFVSTQEMDRLFPSVLCGAKFDGYRYGITPEQFDENDFVILEPSGAAQLAEVYKRKPVYIIGLTADRNELRDRMAARGDSPEAISRRLHNDDHIFAHLPELCDIVVNNRKGWQTRTMAIVRDFIIMCETPISQTPPPPNKLMRSSERHPDPVTIINGRCPV